jgi:hypothetical protein
MATAATATPSTLKERDWTKPSAIAIPREGYFTPKQGRYGPIYPQTPACHGFTIIAKIKPGREDAIRAYGKTIEKAIADLPDALATLKLHYLRWVLFEIGNDTYFMYQGIFDTDFDKYTEDAVALFTKYGVNTVFENLDGFPEDWKTKRVGMADQERDTALKELEDALRQSRLAKEDTFMKRLKNDRERRWLRERRSEEARYWNLLTDWRAGHLSYAP